MKEFKKSIIKYEYNNDDFVLEVEKLIGIQKTKVVGSYIKYGKDKVCDLDLSEDITSLDINNKMGILKLYFNKLNQNKDKFKIIHIYFDMEHSIIKELYNNIGYMDGLFNIHSYNEEKIKELLNKLNNDTITKLFEKYKKDNNYLSFLEKIKNMIYPEWTLDELIKGEKTYHNETFNIGNSSYSYFYIEIIYNDFRTSNYIYIHKQPKTDEKYIIFDDILKNEKIFYYYLIKKLLFFIKWLYYRKLIKEKELVNKTIDLHNEIFDFREEIGNKYNKSCLMSNQIDINKLYNKEDTKLIKKYNEYIDSLNKICEEKYRYFTKDYSYYLEKYIRIC
jgi:hypothetical protein